MVLFTYNIFTSCVKPWSLLPASKTFAKPVQTLFVLKPSFIIFFTHCNSLSLSAAVRGKNTQHHCTWVYVHVLVKKTNKKKNIIISYWDPSSGMIWTYCKCQSWAVQGVRESYRTCSQKMCFSSFYSLGNITVSVHSLGYYLKDPGCFLNPLSQKGPLVHAIS